MSVSAIMLHAPIGGSDLTAHLRDAQLRFARLLRHMADLDAVAFADDSIDRLLRQLEAAAAAPTAAFSPRTIVVHYAGHVATAATVSVHASYRGQTMSFDLVSEVVQAAAASIAACKPNVVIVVDTVQMPGGTLPLDAAQVEGTLQAAIDATPGVGSGVVLFPAADGGGGYFSSRLLECLGAAAGGGTDINAVLQRLSVGDRLDDLLAVGGISGGGGGAVAGVSAGPRPVTVFSPHAVEPPLPLPPRFTRDTVPPAPPLPPPAPVALSPVSPTAALHDGTAKRPRDDDAVPPREPMPDNGICPWCGGDFQSEVNWQQHIEGRKHRNAVAAGPWHASHRHAPPPPLSGGTWAPAPPVAPLVPPKKEVTVEGGPWRCDACKVNIVGRRNAIGHVDGGPHKRAALKNPTASPVPYSTVDGSRLQHGGILVPTAVDDGVPPPPPTSFSAPWVDDVKREPFTL
jgi:hypothetical protein